MLARTKRQLYVSFETTDDDDPKLVRSLVSKCLSPAKLVGIPEEELVAGNIDLDAYPHRAKLTELIIRISN